MRVPFFIIEQGIRMKYAIELIEQMKRLADLYHGMIDEGANEQMAYLQQQYAEQMTKIFKADKIAPGTKILENQNAQL